MFCWIEELFLSVSPSSFSYLNGVSAYHFSFSSKSLWKLFVQPREKAAAELAGASWFSSHFCFGLSIIRGFWGNLSCDISYDLQTTSWVVVLQLPLYHLRPRVLIIFDGNQNQHKYSTIQTNVFTTLTTLIPGLVIIHYVKTDVNSSEDLLPNPRWKRY